MPNSSQTDYNDDKEALEGAKQHDQGLPSEHLFITQHINSNKVTINCNIVSKNLIIIIVCIVENTGAVAWQLAYGLHIHCNTRLDEANVDTRN